MTISSDDPFATPEEHRTPARRLRGRLPTAVTLWTAPGPAGLTVSSTLIADGDPAHVLGLVDDESDLWAALQAHRAFAVTVLTPADRQLADRFAGLTPSPGGLFKQGDWRDTPYGPVPGGPGEHRTWAGCRLAGADPTRVGWALLVDAVIDRIELADTEPLLHHRGRYRQFGG